MASASPLTVCCVAQRFSNCKLGKVEWVQRERFEASILHEVMQINDSVLKNEKQLFVFAWATEESSSLSQV